MDSALHKADVDFGHHGRLSVKNSVLESNWRAGAMKYMLLCCHEEKKVDSMSKSELDAIMEETMSYCEVLKKSGHLLGVEALEPIQTAMSVKVRNGKLSVTDGPFAETKEQLGGSS